MRVQHERAPLRHIPGDHAHAVGELLDIAETCIRVSRLLGKVNTTASAKEEATYRDHAAAAMQCMQAVRAAEVTAEPVDLHEPEMLASIDEQVQRWTRHLQSTDPARIDVATKMLSVLVGMLDEGRQAPQGGSPDGKA
jgi:hypothetical protein